jgi:polar amino acid transport system substrate-binding protein
MRQLLFVLSFLGMLPLYAEQKILKWGGDVSGSAPYLLLDPNNPNRMIGFECDVAEALAREMGMTPQFVQHQWDNLIPGLNRGNFDIVLNGMEITEERKAEVDFSDPYFYTFEQLSVLKDNVDIHDWDDLAGKKVGTIKESLAERLLKEHKNILIATYEDQTPIYDDLVFGRLDAVLYDQPVALYYGSLDKRIKNLDKNFGQIIYGICVRKGEKQLLDKVNRAIQAIARSGELRHIYERWGIWNEAMAKAFPDTSTVHEEPTQLREYISFFENRESSSHRWQQIKAGLPLLLEGALITLKLSSLAMICAIIFGLFIALSRLYGPKPVSAFAIAFVEVIRGTPLLIQLFVIYYGLPNIGIKIDPFPAAILGLALNYSAYESEIYRAGILAIPHAQMETAMALGLNRWQALFHIILPQAIRTVIPPMTNDFIALLKDSSLVSVITLVELTRVYGQLAAASYNYLALGLITAVLYFVMGLPFVRLSRWIERRYSFDTHSLRG